MDETERLQLLDRISDSLDVLVNLTYLLRVHAVQTDEAAYYLEQLASEIQELCNAVAPHVMLDRPTQ
jgi:hypothetical protein